MQTVAIPLSGLPVLSPLAESPHNPGDAAIGDIFSDILMRTHRPLRSVVQVLRREGANRAKRNAAAHRSGWHSERRQTLLERLARGTG